MAAAGRRVVDYAAVVSLPVAGLWLGVRVEGGAVSECDFLSGESGRRARAQAGNGVARECVEQLRRYIENPSFRFTLPLAPRGSPFQQRVWDEMAAIPPGRVRRYGEIARRLGTAARAVGAACRANPLPILVPCHRVVAADGPGGYSGAMSGALHRIKIWLLAHEGYRDGSARRGRAATAR